MIWSTFGAAAGIFVAIEGSIVLITHYLDYPEEADAEAIEDLREPPQERL